jgi:GntR family carbon starvation induced transcriptional regulator
LAREETTDQLTLGSRVYARLREDVISGALEPGRRLGLEMLRERYGVGVTPIREALYRLSASLLVEAEDHLGFRVADISEDHLEQVLAAREHFETMILGDSVRCGDLDWEERVLASHHRLSKLRPYMPNSTHVATEWQLAHRRFHYEILSGRRHFFLEHFESVVWDHAARYRNLLSAGRVSEEVLVDDHEQLVKAVLARDVEMARLVLRRHIEHGAVQLRAQMKRREQTMRNGAASADPVLDDPGEALGSVVLPYAGK